MVAGGLQGAMFALRYATISLNATLRAGRVDPADQFTYRISATASGTVLSSATSSGSGNGPFSPTSSFVTTPQSLTLERGHGTGSASPLSSYNPSLTCTNTASGSPTRAADECRHQLLRHPLDRLRRLDRLRSSANAKAAAVLGITKSAPAPALKVGAELGLHPHRHQFRRRGDRQRAGEGPAAGQPHLRLRQRHELDLHQRSVARYLQPLGRLDRRRRQLDDRGHGDARRPPPPAPASPTTPPWTPPAARVRPAPGPACAPAAACASSGPNIIVYINPQPESGTATAGTAATPIASVIANDAVNGTAASLGAGGNADPRAVRLAGRPG